MFSGYKTVVFNIVMAALMVAKAINPEAETPDVQQVSETIDATLAALAAVWAIGGILLRAISSAPIFNGRLKKKEQSE